MRSFQQPRGRERGRRNNVPSRGRGNFSSRNYVPRGRGRTSHPQSHDSRSYMNYHTKQRSPDSTNGGLWRARTTAINHTNYGDAREAKASDHVANKPQTPVSTRKHTSNKYIPPHLRGKRTNASNRTDNSLKWYRNEQEFEAQLGHSLGSFKLSVSSFVDEKRLNELAHCSTAPCNQSDAKLICIVGPPAVGKSTFFKYYLPSFGVQNEQNAVNSDGDIVRKAHYGINEYLHKSTQLNIGYEGFFKEYVQKWSEEWKMNVRKKAMKQRQHIIAFSTCHKSEKCIKEIEMFIANGYQIKILIVCAEYEKCKQMGLKRERINGRKHLDGAFCKSMQGIMDVVDYLVKYRQMNARDDVFVVRNKYNLTDSAPQRLEDDWINIKNKVLIPMRKRAIHKLFNTYNHQKYNV